MSSGSARPGIGAVWRVETAKLLAQLPTRVLPAVCVLAPFAFALVLRIQTAVPQDTLFGRWVHASGFAVTLVVLSFAGAWGFPVIAGIVGGDIFAGEDRHGTWKTLLTRSTRRSDVFIGKTLAACGYSAAMVVLLALASLAAGVLATGTQPLVGLSGQMIGGGRAAGLTLASWGFALLPALGFTCLALLISVATRSSAAGMLGPLVAALAMQLLSLVGSGPLVRAILLSNALDAWHGLFAMPAFYDQLGWAALLCVVFGLLCLAAAWLILRRRDFAGTGPVERSRGRHLRTAAVAVAALVLLALAGNLGPTGVTAARLERSIATNFSNLTVLQQRLLGRRVPPGSTLKVLPDCRRQGVSTPSRGAGDNWLCTLDIVTPTFAQVPVNYDVAVKANGCYTADGPPAFIGALTIHDREGHAHVNPLFGFDGCFDVAP